MQAPKQMFYRRIARLGKTFNENWTVEGAKHDSADALVQIFSGTTPISPEMIVPDLYLWFDAFESGVERCRK